MNIRLTNLSTYAKSTYLMLAITMIISLVAGLAYAAPAEPEPPKAEISPQASQYAYTASPVFNIQTGSNTYYKVQVALARSIFELSDADAYKITTGERQNFYSTDWLECGDEPINVISVNSVNPSSCENGEGTFTLTSTIWSNLRGSVVFYRLITNSSMSEVGALTSTVEKNTYVKRTGETWYGLPLNDKVLVYDKVENKDIYVVENGELNGVAFESDYGPRYVTGGTRFHPGLDFSVVIGTPIYAIADGKVVKHPNDSSIGRLDLKHLEGTTSEYLSGYVHLDKAVVSLNEDVKAGQLIAYSGDEGADGAHLHFEAGFEDDDKFHNPLDYVPYTDEHVIRPDLGTFLADSNTNNHRIDVRNAAGDQDIVLISFGVTTDYDKDLNYVSVQVDEITENGWFYVLNYNDVKEQNSSTGVVTLDNGRTFRVRPMGDDIYNDSNLAYDFYVKPAATYTGLEAKDYFFFPWDVSTLENKEDGGPHEIVVKLGEVDDPPVEHMLTIGPEVYPTSIDATQTSLTYDLTVSNYDIPENNNGTIHLEVAGLPSGWTASFSEANPTIEVDGSQTITLTLATTFPQMISADEMRENNTRVIATFGRIQALQDNWVFCPSNVIETMATTAASSNTTNGSDAFCPTETAKVTITKPTDGDPVPANKVYNVEVSAPGAASDVQASLDVEDLTDGTWLTLNQFIRKEDTFIFNWTPAEVEHEYGLTAWVDGFAEPSGTVTVTAVNDEVIFKDPTNGSMIEGGVEKTVIVEAPYGATKVFLEIYPADPSAGGDMVKAADGNWQFTGWVPSKDVDYYNLTATAYENGSQLAYTLIRVEPIPDKPTIHVPTSVQFGETVDVTVTAPRAFAVTLFAGGQVDDNGRDGDIWRFRWTPDASGDFIVWANASYDNQPDQPTEEVIVHVIDESQNLVDVTIEQPKDGAVLYVGVDTTIVVSTPYGELSKVLIEIKDEHGNVEEKSFTAEENGGNFTSVGIPWLPPKEGEYSIKANAWDTEGRKGWTPDEEIVNVTAIVPAIEDVATWTPINEYAYLWKNKNPISYLFSGGYTLDPKFFDTRVPYSGYFCGIVGIDARGGDIGEKSGDDIIEVYMDMASTREKGTWQLMAAFSTWNGSDHRVAKWDVQVLCIDRSVISLESSQPGKPVFFSQPFTGLGDNVGAHTDVSTGIDADEYVCGIIGFDSNEGDIQEFDDGDIILNYLFRKNGTWHIREEFRTHNGQHENWDIRVFCIHQDWASIDQPEAGKPFLLKEYSDLGDNITYPTEFDVDDWTCGIVGFAARDGDIDENNQSPNTNLILAYMQEGTEKWHIRADFRTHNDGESWDINVLCMHKDLSAPPRMLGAAPQLFTGQDENGDLYGPGMALTFEETYHPDAEYYEIQFSEDGGTTWQLIDNQRLITIGGWRNHHGNLDCGYGFGRCLKRNQVYSYRVRVLDSAQNPLTDWSDVISATSMEWPAHVQLANPIPEGPYNSPHTVTLSLVDTYGYNMTLNWQIAPWSGASYTILSGCEQDSYSCKIEIRDGSGSTASVKDGGAKLALLAPVTSVDVKVIGESVIDNKTYTSVDEVKLTFKDECIGDDCIEQDIFIDVPSEHWASGYINFLYENGYTSGCSSGEDLEFCADEWMTRGETSVFLVRTYHSEEPGYTPKDPEVVTFEDLHANPSWVDKWAMELLDRGATAGCSSDPLLFCSDDVTTRAQMAVFGVRTLLGESYVPYQPQDQLFNDVPLYDANGNLTWAPKWIHEAYHQGLIQACQTDMVGMKYRPDDAITRGEAACILYYALTNTPAIE